MAKQTEKKAGYITYLSPTKPCKGGGTQYEVTIQDGETTATKAQGFGSDGYRKLLPYHQSKSPIKIELFKNPGYNTPTFNGRCKVADAVFQEVPFKYDTRFGEQSGSGEKKSEEKDIAAIIKADNFDAYYTVSGRVKVGTGPVKVRNGAKLKDDISIYDKSRSTSITLWNMLWEQMQTGDTVQLTHLKLRSFKDKTYLTSSPFTKLVKVEDEEDIPAIPEESDALEEFNMKTVEVNEFEAGLVATYSACKVCQKKVVDSDIRAYSFSCKQCHINHPIDNLVSTYLLPFSIVVDEELKPLTLSQAVGERDMQVSSADELVDSLMGIMVQKKVIKVKFDTENDHVVSISKE